MKSFRVSKKFNRVRLPQELTAQGVSGFNLRTASAVNEDFPVAIYGVIVTSDAAVDATVRAVIAAHTETGSASRTPTAEEMESALVQMEKL